MATPAFVDKSTGQKRVYALDALRGIAILMMVLSSVEPTGVLNHLPSFMYHAQVPPPTFEFDPNNPLPGVSWVDMVFPFFLFSMGAAIPLALSRRIEKGVHWSKLVGATLLRGLMLSIFAIYIEHIRTGCVDAKYTAGMLGSSLKLFLLGTGGFFLLFPMLGRLPATWKPRTQFIVKAAGWAAAIVLMGIVRYDPDVSLAKKAAFSLNRFDVIIMILANVAVYTTLVYLATRKNQMLRLGSLGFVLALQFSGGPNGWVKSLEANFPIPYSSHLSFVGHTGMSIINTINGFFSLTVVSYLFITIFGTIVGDKILEWMNASGDEKPSWSTGHFRGLMLLLFGTTVLTIVLLKGRHIWELVLSLIPLLSLGTWLVRKPADSLERMIAQVYKIGVYMLALGMFFEPYEGGIKKDPATMSYFFVAGGLAVFTLLVFTIAIERFKGKRAVQLLVDNGQNPMIAYAAGGNLVGTTLAVTGLSAAVEHQVASPWLYFCYSVVFTLLVAGFVSLCTRKKIFWRT